MRNVISLIVPALCLLAACKKNPTNTTNNTQPPPPSNPLSNGLIAYYPFSGNANDSSGNNYHLSVNEAVLISSRFGEPSKAYGFNGTTSYMTIPKLPKGDTLRELTISY